MLAGAWATWLKAADGDDREDLQPSVCPPLWIRRDAIAGIGIGVLTGFFGVLRRRDFSLATAAIACAVLVGLALIGTFAPFFQLFAPD
jgi:hypothetical protein